MEWFVTGIVVGLAFLLGGRKFSSFADGGAGAGYGGAGGAGGRGGAGAGSGSGAGSSGGDCGCGCGGASAPVDIPPSGFPAPLAPFAQVTAPGSSWGRPGGMGPGYSARIVTMQYGA